MKISSKGLALIKRFEGCRLAAYKDAGGVATIGYGHTRGVVIGQTITQAQADAFLVEDCAGAEAAVNKYMNRYNFNQNQFDALVSFAFNIGSIDKLTVNGSRTIAEISEKIPAYCYCGGQKLQGLVNRRTAEKELFDTPVSGQAMVQAASTTSVTNYIVGKTYTLQTELKVRMGAGTNYAAKSHKQLTTDAKKHDVDGDGALNKGTVVTCKEIKKVGNDVWIRTPSGWLAAYYHGNVYIK